MDSLYQKLNLAKTDDKLAEILEKINEQFNYTTLEEDYVGEFTDDEKVIANIEEMEEESQGSNEMELTK